MADEVPRASQDPNQLQGQKNGLGADRHRDRSIGTATGLKAEVSN